MSVSKLASQVEYSSVKDKSSIQSLLQCRTMVESKDFVSTGTLTYIEGDILEIEISEGEAYRLGDPVKMTVYSPAGIYVFQSTIVARDSGSLIILNTPQNWKHFNEKRVSPRVNVRDKGKLRSILDQEQINDVLKEQAVPLVVDNISITGVGFTMIDDLDIKPNHKLQVELDLGFELKCIVEVARVEKVELGTYYGAQFIGITEEKLNSLRAYVLKKASGVLFRNQERIGETEAE